ncbi:toll/interleukin-1 receptor domain-containing protein [Streptomyces sp. CS090A]|uniref:toll/interleukin-1 receptor domain-containing protein n=1 Tax=Streptomyces sp. CS090A TaxID=2162710 RepID=UPI0013A58E3C|nr:toll/interleukin-1 receptor domain-containing protein [Streptomyces sp. CS090A]
MGGLNPHSGRLNVFLSHRYNSPAENQYFWQLLTSVEGVSFRVDEALSFTSPVRLERMVRDADGFVGIYPLPGGPREAHSLSSLRHASRYFRLELGMAVRARKHAVVFHDQRLIPALRAPLDVRLVAYDAQELDAGAHSSLPARVRHAYQGFLDDVHAALPSDARPTYQSRSTGLIVSPQNQASVTSALSEMLHEYAWEPMVLPWPPRLNLDLITWLRKCDWAVIDLDDPASRLVAAFTHGQFVPTLALTSTAGSQASQDHLDVPDEKTLYGDVETGHRKAVVRWSNPEHLLGSVESHLKVIGEQPRYIGDTDQAVDYFGSAAKRSERVFLSYAAEDGETAAEFSRLLNARFQDVFDYRSHGTIKVGEQWMDTLLTGLARSAIGVLLLSKSYVASKYCMLEARELYRAAVEGRAALVPVCLERMELPDFLQGTQYRALYHQSPQAIVEELRLQTQ